MKQPLQATSNVIELKPGKKYLLIFQQGSIEIENMSELMDMFHKKGIDGIGIAIKGKDGPTIIEI